MNKLSVCIFLTFHDLLKHFGNILVQLFPAAGGTIMSSITKIIKFALCLTIKKAITVVFLSIGRKGFRLVRKQGCYNRKHTEYLPTSCHSLKTIF